MSPPFETAEYDRRLSLVRAEMESRGLSAMVIGDPANINWLTGYDAWSFYTPQMMLVSLTDGPWWMGRLMDCLLYTSPSPRDVEESRMPSSA